MEERHLKFRITELEEELKMLRLHVTSMKTQIRNAITELEEDDIDAAIDTLTQIK